ncbi:MAG: ATP-binding protein [Elusimicrobia bacterium]|nr:ATP-binding protein [Elusimicrobiota bacterium]
MATQSKYLLPADIERRLRDGNPWWSGNEMEPPPPFRRWAFQRILKNFELGLAPAVLLRGPRQVGKSTLQAQIIQHLIETRKAHPKEILYVQFDSLPSWREFRKVSLDPILHIAGWFEDNVIRKPFNQLVRERRTAYLFFDEVQNLPEWASQIKNLVDRAKVKVLATGSSALRVGLGKESLAGRVSDIRMGPMRLWEIGAMGRLDLAPCFPQNGAAAFSKQELWQELVSHGVKHADARRQAFRWFSERGGYPVAHVRREAPWEEVAAQLKATVIDRVIQLDLRAGGQKAKGRDPRLLEETFRVACRYSGQYPSPAKLADEVRRALQRDVGVQRISYYLRFLDQTLLLRLVPPLELRLKRRKGHDKICLCDHGLRKAWLGEPVPLDPESLDRDPDAATVAGRLAEGAVGYYLGEFSELNLNHFPAREVEPEVDFVITAGDRRIPVEVKYTKRLDPVDDTDALKRFLEKSGNRASFGLLVTREDTESDLDPRIIRIPASSLLLLR